MSALQKIRMSDGKIYGALNEKNRELRLEPYEKFLKTIIKSDSPSLLKNFILTIGVVSNHGNWFSSKDHNKELRVLAQSYDWLLFLTDNGLARFVEDLLLNPVANTGKSGRHLQRAIPAQKAAINLLKYKFLWRRIKPFKSIFQIISRKLKLGLM